MADVVRPEEIEALIAQFDASRCAELHIRFDGFELHLSNDPATARSARTAEPALPAPVAPVAPISDRPPPRPAPSAAPSPPVADDLEGFEIVRAPYLGTFYRAPKPGEPSYVELGASVEPETNVCLVEVMKLFTAVRAGVAGIVAKVLVADGAMVEAGQPLFAIDARG